MAVPISEIMIKSNKLMRSKVNGWDLDEAICIIGQREGEICQMAKCRDLILLFPLMKDRNIPWKGRPIIYTSIL